MYFGGFGMKTAPAMGKKNYSISTSLTGDSGEAFLATLTDAQRKLITDLVDLQRQDLAEIVKTRRAIATELRRFQKGESADKDKVLSLSRRYGELDGEMSYLYATAFAKVGKTLTAEQKAEAGQDAHVQPFRSQGPVPVLVPDQHAEDREHGLPVRGEMNEERHFGKGVPELAVDWSVLSRRNFDAETVVPPAGDFSDSGIGRSRASPPVQRRPTLGEGSTCPVLPCKQRGGVPPPGPAPGRPVRAPEPGSGSALL